MPRWSGSLCVPMTSMRSPAICRATKCSISSDALSAHCRFSSTMSSGRFAAKRDEELREVPEQSCFELGRITARGGDARRPPSSAGKSCTSSAVPPRVSSVSTDGSTVRSTRKQRVREHGVRNAGFHGIRAADRNGESALRRLLGERRRRDAFFRFRSRRRRRPCDRGQRRRRRGRR